MCGFTGFWEARASRDADELTALVERMAETLRSRGPDDGSTWVDAGRGLALGFRRLSIQDLTAAGRQPMTSRSGRMTLVFNGEIYNASELRQRLDGPWRGHSDTEIFLEHLERYGVEPTLRRADGMFAFALWDGDARELTLARDRFGEKPLFYGSVGGVFFFGSQPKSFRPHPAFRVEASHEALSEFVRYGYIPWPFCAFRGLRKLGPGHLVRARAGAIAEERCWWSAVEAAARGHAEARGAGPDAATEAGLVDETERRLRASVQRRLVSDVPIGAFLSGGIDSSLVVALMTEASPQKVHTFSIGFAEPEFDESGWARRVAGALGTEHHAQQMTPGDAQQLLDRLPEIFDEPFGDASQVPMLLLSRFARERVTVALSGDGGDEIFSGYERYDVVERRWGALRAQMIPRLPGVVGHLAAALLSTPSRRGPAELRRIAGRLRRELSSTGPGALEHFYREQLCFFDPPDVLTRAVPESEGWWSGRLQSAAPDVRERLQLLDQLTYLPEDILTKVDRATMAASLEARTPFLAPDVVELAWRLPRSLRHRDGKGKHVLRELLARRLPSALFERPKMGFAVPIGRWLVGPLRDWAESLLSVEALQRFGVLRVAPVRRMWDEHLTGRVEHESRLWPLLVLQAWCGRWMSSS